MNRLRLFVLSSFFSTTAAAMLLAACSSDTSISVAQEFDADVDDASDASTARPGKDGGSKDDAGFDEDSGPDGDGSVEDDASQDAGPDADEFDGGLTFESYTDIVADTLCTSVSRCCFGPTPVPDGGAVDGGTYDPATCLQLGKELGFNATNFGVKWASSERLELNPSKAAECLNKIKALSCSLTGAELRAARASCFAALQGKQPLAAPCSSSIECAQGYCKPVDPQANPTAANGGVCTSLAAKDGDCGGAFATGNSDIDQQYAEEVCSTRNSGDTKLHCNSYDYAPLPEQYRDRADWKCVEANVPNGGGCSSTSWCATGICTEESFTCQDPVHLLEQSCSQLIKTP